MEIQQLRHVQAAALNSSYSRAAEECFTSRQNIAHSVKALEAELGVKLFERKGNGVVLTPTGKIVARRIDGIVASADGLRLMFAESVEKPRIINLAISNNLFAGMPNGLDPWFEDGGNRFRFVEYDCERCYRSVLSVKADAAIVSCMQREFQSCSAYEVLSTPSYIITDAASPLALRESVSVSDLRNERLLLMSEPTFQYEPLFKQLDLLGYDRDDVNVISSPSLMIHMLRNNAGGICGIVSEKYVHNPPEGTAVVRVSDPQLQWHIYILYRLTAESSSMVMNLAQSVRAAFEADSIDGYLVQH